MIEHIYFELECDCSPDFEEVSLNLCSIWAYKQFEPHKSFKISFK